MENDYRGFSLRLKEEHTRCSLTQQLCGCTEMQQTPSAGLRRGSCALQTRYRALPGTSSHTCLEGPREASLGQVQKQLSYLQFLSGDARTNRNILYRLRNHHGYTQREMADLLGMDIKTLRSLEKGRRLPDSELILKMHHLFHISPVLILNDPMGLRNELNYVLGLLTDDDRDVMLKILESSYKLVSA